MGKIKISLAGYRSHIRQVLQELRELHIEHQCPVVSSALWQTPKDALRLGVSLERYMLGAPRHAPFNSPQEWYFKSPKLDFPNGENAQGWLQMANHYYTFNPIEERHKVFICFPPSLK